MGFFGCSTSSGQFKKTKTTSFMQPGQLVAFRRRITSTRRHWCELRTHCSELTVRNHLSKRRHLWQVFLPLQNHQSSLFGVLFLRKKTKKNTFWVFFVFRLSGRAPLGPSGCFGTVPATYGTFFDGGGRHHIKCTLSCGCGDKLWDNSFSTNTCTTQGANWPVGEFFCFLIKLCKWNTCTLASYARTWTM